MGKLLLKKSRIRALKSYLTGKKITRLKKTVKNMKIEKSPSLRKAISPWSESDTACLIMALAAFVVVLFGIDGIKVARQVDAYHDYVWVPVLLLSLSVTVFVTNLIRIVKRYGKSSSM